ncbi:hypothetical protein [Vibrio sp. 3-2(1)]|uniref:hypothetical protein n=1 Tax=Vibrio sp. 3-2(1) TaxID=2591016 RepID=UPI001483AEB6|nr:hypothetical protein [Vibrio sp. 3-2(1)]NNN70881.1 hypothetical protein [Vibrio sp. 3-2(1)]
MESTIRVINKALSDIDDVLKTRKDLLKLCAIYDQVQSDLNIGHSEDMILRNKVFVPYVNEALEKETRIKRAMVSAFTEVPTLKNLCERELGKICPPDQVTETDVFTVMLTFGGGHFDHVLRHYGYLNS